LQLCNLFDRPGRNDHSAFNRCEQTVNSFVHLISENIPIVVHVNSSSPAYPAKAAKFMTLPRKSNSNDRTFSSRSPPWPRVFALHVQTHEVILFIEQEKAELAR
jgi:hypothetical protein